MRCRGGVTQNNVNVNYTAVETCRLALFIFKMKYFRVRKEEVHGYITKLFVRKTLNKQPF